MYIKIKVFPDQKKESFLEVSSLRYEAKLRVPAERNLANSRLIELAADYFGLPSSKIRIISGHHSPSKILVVENEN